MYSQRGSLTSVEALLVQVDIRLFWATSLQTLTNNPRCIHTFSVFVLIGDERFPQTRILHALSCTSFSCMETDNDRNPFCGQGRPPSKTAFPRQVNTTSLIFPSLKTLVSRATKWKSCMETETKINAADQVRIRPRSSTFQRGLQISVECLDFSRLFAVEDNSFSYMVQ